MDLSVISCCLAFVLIGNFVTCQKTETVDRRLKWVLENAGPSLAPSKYHPVEVTLGLELSAVREVDTTRGEVEVTVVRTLSWVNPRMTTENSFTVDTKHLWMPDIVAFNAVHAPELLTPPLAVVIADGTITYFPRERVRFQCNLADFDTAGGANCTLVYGSWTYDAMRLGLRLKEDDTGPISTTDYQEDSRFDLLKTYAEVKVKHYPCCDEAFPAARFTFNIRKKREGTSYRWFTAW